MSKPEGPKPLYLFEGNAPASLYRVSSDSPSRLKSGTVAQLQTTGMNTGFTLDETKRLIAKLQEIVEYEEYEPSHIDVLRGLPLGAIVRYEQADGGGAGTWMKVNDTHFRLLFTDQEDSFESRYRKPIEDFGAEIGTDKFIVLHPREEN